ncbi:MAG: flagellin [Lachnospiraceae bacterium]|jgi:Flagellin and related hook-associated proteins|nr:flagellin [Lachnospiraceae bacterium]
MRIQHNIKALNAQRTLSKNNSLEKTNVEKLASGFRINRAADDAAGLNISEEMRAQVTGLDQAFSNSQDGISLVETIEGSMTEVHSMLNRMVSLAVQSANGTYSEGDRETIQQEVDDLVREIVRIKDTTNFNGFPLLQGDQGKGTILLQIAETGVASSQLEVKLPNLSEESLGIKDISVRTADEARAAIAELEKGIDYVSQQRGEVGAYENRLKATANNLNTMNSNISASESRIRDVDMAKEEMKRVKNDIFGESAQAMLAQANQVPEGLLPLLQQ